MKQEEMRRGQYGMPDPAPLEMGARKIEERQEWWKRLLANPYLGPLAKFAIFMALMTVLGMKLAVSFGIIAGLYDVFQEYW